MKVFSLVMLLSLMFVSVAGAQTITVRHSSHLRPLPSTRTSSPALLSPHTQLLLLEDGSTAGFYHVRTMPGIEGWVWGRNVRTYPIHAQNLLRLTLSRLEMPWHPIVSVTDDDCPVDKNGCRSCYQHKEDGDCKDDPGVHHYHPPHEPSPGEECWVIQLCWCERGQRPGSESCAPCSDGGEEVVCKSH